MGGWVHVGNAGDTLQKVFGGYVATIRQASGMTLAELTRQGSFRAVATIRFPSPDIAMVESDCLLQSLALNI